MNISHKQIQIYFFIALFGLVLVLLAGILKPFISVLVIAGALAIVFRPIKNFFEKILFKSSVLGSLMTVIVALALIVVPLFIFSSTIFHEANSLYTAHSFGEYHLIAKIQQSISHVIPGIDISSSLQQAASKITGSLSGIFSTTVQAVLFFFLGLISFYFFLKDGKKFKAIILRMSPLDREYDDLIISKIERATNSIIRGSLVVALAQGLVTGLGFWIFGVPNPALWGSVTVIAALVPTIGTGLVAIPAILFLYTGGFVVSAVGLAIWSVVAVGLIDNLLGPLLIARGIEIHPFLIILSVIGGLSFFGLAGFLLGPLTLSLFFVLSEMYKPIFQTKEE